MPSYAPRSELSGWLETGGWDVVGVSVMLSEQRWRECEWTSRGRARVSVQHFGEHGRLSESAL